jgi:hypothetical protein
MDRWTLAAFLLGVFNGLVLLSLEPTLDPMEEAYANILEANRIASKFGLFNCQHDIYMIQLKIENLRGLKNNYSSYSRLVSIGIDGTVEDIKVLKKKIGPNGCSW